MEVGDGFSAAGRHRIEAAVQAAEVRTGLLFTVVVGRCNGDTRAHAQRLLAKMSEPDVGNVVVFISPQQRVVEVVTNGRAHRQISNESCALAIASMTTSFAVGDLTGGIVAGLRMLGEAVRAA